MPTESSELRHIYQGRRNCQTISRSKISLPVRRRSFLTNRRKYHLLRCLNLILEAKGLLIMGTFKQHFSDSPAFIAFLIVVICQSFTITSAQVQDDKPVLIIFHGVNESRDDMRALASASNETKMFAQVVVVGYDWKKNRIPVAAPRIFNSISNRFPNSNFVLIGNKEGGILAEWIASRVRTAENKIVRVITLNSPLNGQTLKSDGEGAAIEDLQPDSEVLRLLKSPLVNVRSLDFVRLWEKDNKWVDQEGALRE